LTTATFSFFPFSRRCFSSKMYRWCRKNTKSRWLWKVTTRRPLNMGSWWNRLANMRPTRCPSRVSKLFSTSSGRWLEARPWPCRCGGQGGGGRAGHDLTACGHCS
jgi:hypothetical protein